MKLKDSKVEIEPFANSGVAGSAPTPLRKRIVLGVTGSIAIFKAAALVSHLVKLGFEVQVVASPDSLHFAGEALWEGLSGRPVFMGNFQPGQMMNHIYLSQWADLFVVYPCTARSLSEFSQGSGASLLASLSLAWEPEKAFLLAPAMNPNMWTHPAVISACENLKKQGAKILEPAEGVMACGAQGVGRLIEPEVMALEIERAISGRNIKKIRVLITGGGTREPLDRVRFIGNVSTGRTAAQLADYLYTQGFEVNLITSHSAMRPQAPLKCHFYTSFQELRERLRVELSSSHFDVLIHAAAVSDFHVVRPRDLPHQGKWSSDKDIQLTLAPNPKLVNSVREWSAAKAIRVVAFKLTDTTDKNERIEATQELMNSSGADVVVSNDFNELSELSHSGWFVPAVGTRQHFESNGQLNSLVGVWLNK